MPVRARSLVPLLALAVLAPAAPAALAAGPPPAAATAAAKAKPKAVKLARNAKKVNGIRASRTPKPGRLLPLGKDGRFPASVIPALPAPAATATTPAALPPITACGAGSAIRAIAANGTTTCEPTGAEAGSGLTRTDRTLAVDPAVVQQRVGAPCAAGSALTAIGQDGATTCAPVVSGATADRGLEVAGASRTLGIKLPLELTTSSAGSMVDLDNNGSGQALEASSNSTFATAYFSNSGTGGTIRADTGSSGQGSAITAYNYGTDRYAAELEVVNAANPRAALYARTAGNGQAIDAEVNSNTNGDALFARTTSSNASSYAGIFVGNVSVSGNLAKSSGSFEIDHPLDPANKLLRHSFVESPDMKDLYDGVVTTDDEGKATVTMPDWFEALNRDFRYQLTPIGSFSRAMVAEEMEGNRFTIRTEDPGVRVSWQVTGTRHDAWANAHRIRVEEEKAPADRGRYRTPEVFGQPASRAMLRPGR